MLVVASSYMITNVGFEGAVPGLKNDRFWLIVIKKELPVSPCQQRQVEEILSPRTFQQQGGNEHHCDASGWHRGM